MTAAVVAATLVRELLRALLVPLRLLLYLPRRRHWRQVAREVLADVAAHGGGGDQALDLSALRGRLPRRRGHRDRPPHLFVSAGEASGEAHAVRLLRALHGDGLRCTGFGGQAMQQAGATLLHPLSEHAVMGFTAVLAHLPQLVAAFARFVRLLREDPPDLVVLVDYPGLHLVMAKAARRHGVPVLHYIAPQYWAWGPWRMRRYRRAVSATLTILPFEPAFFRRFGVAARYVGHPLLDELDQVPPDPATVQAARARPTLCLLPGSRRAEIQANLPGMLAVAAALRADHPDLRVVLPHRDPRRTELIAGVLAAHGAAWVEHQQGALAGWLAGSRLVLAKSGTGSLEACLHGTPTVVVYQLRSPLAAFGYHNFLSVPWIAGANLVAGRAVVPEFCFHHRSGWDDVTRACRELFAVGPVRTRCLQDLAEVKARLGHPGASARAAEVVRQLLASQEPMP